jgi:DNA modification methylase
LQKFASCIEVNPDLTRAIVSFQADKRKPFFSWLKYKEAFSADLVRYLLREFAGELRPHTRREILDPFSGIGTTLVTAAAEGWDATGIELLPVGAAATTARLAATRVDLQEFARCYQHLKELDFTRARTSFAFPHIRITRNAFPSQTETEISVFRAFMETIHDSDVRALVCLAALAVLEDCSFTRKDGQYLRWDNRSGRKGKSEFRKGLVLDFKSALCARVGQIGRDLQLIEPSLGTSRVELIEGSCLLTLPKLETNRFHLTVTSPPYCNRYDYTRTYALELAFLGYTDSDVSRLRQTLLSATVENRSKGSSLLDYYGTIGRGGFYAEANASVEQCDALQEVLSLLNSARSQGKLNNGNIPAMIRNYFFEMSFVIKELARVTAAGGRIIMINDNVQYHGEGIPVDLILSDFAQRAGLVVERIWVLQRGKGNSSQQMGIHGRRENRKGVYVWHKPGRGL